MTNDEADAAVLGALKASDKPLKFSEIAGVVFPVRFDDDNEIIDAAIERLLKNKLIKDVSDESDWHPHYAPVNPLEALAEIMKKPRRRRRR